MGLKNQPGYTIEINSLKFDIFCYMYRSFSKKASSLVFVYCRMLLMCCYVVVLHVHVGLQKCTINSMSYNCKGTEVL